jgi:two-component system, sensor histidine kinase LadS
MSTVGINTAIFKWLTHTLQALLQLGWVLACLLFALNPANALAQNALPQSPSPAASLPSSALVQRQQPLIELAASTQHMDILPLTEYWIDDGNTRLDELIARSSAGVDLFKPSRAMDAHKIDGKALWIRFEIRRSDPRTRWLLELGSPLIDDVQLFWQDPENHWVMLKAGDAVPRSQWPLQTRLPTFTLPSDNSSYTQYYLRVQNARFPVSLPMHIYRDSAYITEHHNELMLLGSLIGLATLMLLTSAAMAVLRREQAFAAYGVYMLALGLFILTNVGLTPLYFWNDSPVLADRANYALAGLTAAIGPWLVRLIVQPNLRRNTVDLLLAAVALFMLLTTILELWYPSMLSYHMLNLGTLGSVVMVYTLVAVAWQRGEAITRWVALCFAPVALSALPLILRNLGVIPNSWLTQYSVPIASAIEMPLLLYALFVRSAERREGLARAAGLPTRDALTGLPNTRSFLEHLHGSMTRAHRFNHNYGLILVDLSNYAWFTKEHGREMADRALIITSTRLQQLVRDVDCVCRLDENQFVILVEGHCSASLMTKISARISACAHQPTDILPVGATLKLMITCALMPNPDCQEAGDDANAKLGWLISAAESMPADNHKSVRTIGF